MKDYTIITPVYNDWSSLELLISRMDQSLADMKINLKIIVVDDCSTFPNETDYSALKYEVIDEIHLVELTSPDILCKDISQSTEDAQVTK